jgi:hypothetical protein
MLSQKQRADLSEKMSPWKNAGIMLSYWCSASCRFCYVSSCPKYSLWADPQRVVNWWQQLESLQNRHGDHVKIHLTGGEAFGNWDLLVKILQLAQSAGLPPVEKIETNAFWATDDSLVEDRLQILKDFGVTLITSDADIFHQEFVPIENVRRLVLIGQKVLGPEGIRVRWWDFYNFALENKLDVALMDPAELREVQADALMNGRERMNGRAAVLSAKLLKGQPIEAFANENCERGLLKSKHVHIDPYGNIFPGTCCGIVLGNAVSEDIAGVFDWLNTHGPTGPVIATLLEKGPFGLIEFAKRFGFKPLPQGYVSKCQLCYHLRHTIYIAGHCKKWLGPEECYPPSEW